MYYFCRNLKYAAGLSPLVAGKANFADIYVSCCERFLKVRGRQMTYETSVLFDTHAVSPHPSSTRLKTIWRWKVHHLCSVLLISCTCRIEWNTRS